MLAVLALTALFGLSLFAPSLPGLRAQEPTPPGDGAAPAPGEGTAPAAGGGKPARAEMSVGERIVTWTIYGILFLTSIVLVALIVLLFLDVRLGAAVPPSFVEEFTDTVNRRKFKEAYEMAREDTSYLGRVLSTGMSRLQYGLEDARESAMNMVDSIRVSKEQWIAYLATIGTLGPLLGLVGTVIGMIMAFSELGKEGKKPDPAVLALGISTALRLTLFGVGLAVPAILFHAFFRNRLATISVETSNMADDLLTQMYHNSKKPAPAGAPETRPAPSASVRSAE